MAYVSVPRWTELCPLECHRLQWSWRQLKVAWWGQMWRWGKCPTPWAFLCWKPGWHGSSRRDRQSLSSWCQTEGSEVRRKYLIIKAKKEQWRKVYNKPGSTQERWGEWWLSIALFRETEFCAQVWQFQAVYCRKAWWLLRIWLKRREICLKNMICIPRIPN